MKKHTTKAHYETYEAMSKAVPTNMMGYTKEELEKLFADDDALNNINMYKKIDPQYSLTNRYLRISGMDVKGFSLADNTCVIKHILIYRVLGVEPILHDTFSEIMAAKRAA